MTVAQGTATRQYNLTTIARNILLSLSIAIAKKRCREKKRANCSRILALIDHLDRNDWRGRRDCSDTIALCDWSNIPGRCFESSMLTSQSTARDSPYLFYQYQFVDLATALSSNTALSQMRHAASVLPVISVINSPKPKPQ